MNIFRFQFQVSAPSSSAPMTCLDIACAAECYDFISHAACRNLIEQEWYGALSSERSPISIFLATVVLFIPGLSPMGMVTAEDERFAVRANDHPRPDQLRHSNTDSEKWFMTLRLSEDMQSGSKDNADRASEMFEPYMSSVRRSWYHIQEKRKEYFSSPVVKVSFNFHFSALMNLACGNLHLPHLRLDDDVRCACSPFRGSHLAQQLGACLAGDESPRRLSAVSHCHPAHDFHPQQPQSVGSSCPNCFVAFSGESLHSRHIAFDC